MPHIDWNDALIHTTGGTGDSVSYSIRSLRDGKSSAISVARNGLPCAGAPRNGLAAAYGCATQAAGFRKWHHEGKLTGLSARGRPSWRSNLPGIFVSATTDWSIAISGTGGKCKKI